MHRTVRTFLAAAAAALSATTVIVGLAFAPAQAMNYDSVPLSARSYTDKAQASAPNPDPSGDFLIGTRDGHTGRAYFTFDLTPLKGQVLHRVTFYTTERSVNDCSSAAPIEVWRTKPVTATTTWQHPPKDLELLDQRSYGSGVICPGAYLGVELVPAVQAAFARGDKTLTLAVRIAASAENDPKAGRTMTRARMSYAANHAPKVSGLKLKFPEGGCGTLDKHPAAGTFMQVQATATDADPADHPRITYAYWPVDRPGERKESSSPSLGLAGLADGTVVAWTARAADNDDAGPWGRTCYFTVDTTAPTTTPVVSSKKYPSADFPGTGGPGVPGTFVFDAGGDTEVTGFVWNRLDGGLGERVKANHPGGRAKVTITPPYAGRGRLEVAALDAAGNRGVFVRYEYQVRNTAPYAVFEMNGVGLTSHIKLQTAATEVTSFGYAVDGGPETRVPATGGRGEGDLVFDSVGTKTVVSRAYAGTKMIGAQNDSVTVTDAPKVTSADFDWTKTPVVGVPGTFTFTPRTTNVVGYLYSVNDGDEQRVDARPDGTAELAWTPETPRGYTITVSSVDASGNRSQPSRESFSVVDNRPGVEAYTFGARVGDPVAVSAWSDLPNAVAMVYSFDGGPQREVAGSFATFEVVPAHAGDSPVTVWAKLADGSLSPSTTYVLHIESGPRLTAHGPFGEEAVAGRPLTLTLGAGQEGAATFRYQATSSDGVDLPELTVPVDADGKATVTVDVPDAWTGLTITAVSLSADGVVSDSTSRWVLVRDPRVDVNVTPAPLGEPSQFGFSAWDLTEVTTKFLWRVDDGPVQEAPYDWSSWETVVSYTADRAGEHTLSVRREFTDGSLSPVTAVPFTIG
ncbi:hypothetical protein Ade02nite_16400 [Paractinoplanes deccanensis]|uniref:DNRLRE domain-containing protein n=1 Tax=Paractinoplanes deccanensis TaxID=113561 RepID=A0ABQ3XZ30_9ACTN|nr:hypothetical protein [Actinoplanes deccanensis]GID72999.1 hypothetical protein Ade02nite_16400 [Actinoplanes deccanensis]